MSSSRSVRTNALLSLICAAVILAVPTAVHAEVFDELAGVRSAAMGGAHRGLGDSNDSLILNPAGMALSKRYSADFNYGFSPFDDLNRINLSVVDSKSGPVAGGIAYTHDRGDKNGVNPRMHRLYVGSAYPITENLALGATFRYIRGRFTRDRGARIGERQNVKAYTVDAGLAASFGPLGLGIAFNNIIKDEVGLLTPPTLGAGASLRMSGLALAGDITVDFRQDERRPVSFNLGGEYFVGSVPLRIGYQSSPYVDLTDGSRDREHMLGGGLGYITKAGGIEATYVHSLTRGDNWNFILAFKFFV